MFIRYFKIEIKKALSNKIFFIVLLVGIGVTLLSSMNMIQNFMEFKERQMLAGLSAQAEYNSLSLYGRWIGGEYHTIGVALYFFLFPLFSIMSYGWSYFNEKKNRVY